MTAELLKAEREYFEELKPELLKHHLGQFVLIKGRELLGAFTKLEEAYAEGVKRLGNVPMFIKQVVPVDPVHYIFSALNELFRAS